MEEDIKQRLLKLAEERVKEKINEERRKTEKQIENEIKDVEFILELIEKKMLYKKIGKNYEKNQKFVMITKEIFLEDYSKEREYDWQRKLEIKDNEFFDSENYELKIIVNGVNYYHIGSIIKDFETELKKKIDRIKYVTEGLYDLEKDFEQLKNQEQNIKKFIEDYNEVNKELNQ